MANSEKLSPERLKEFYQGDYVAKYHAADTGRLKNIVRNIEMSTGDSVVDFACGNGLLLEAFASLPRLYRGVDFSEEFVHEAQKRYGDWPGDIEFVCQDIVAFCQQHTAQFDWAFALDFSEHIYDDQFLDIFSAIVLTLRANGKLVLHTPNADFFVERLKARNFLLKQFPQHIAVRNAAEYHALLVQAGFCNIEVIYLPHYHSLLGLLAPLQNWPLLRKFLRARLLIIAQPQREEHQK